jgi:hypothetical protein
MPDNTNPAWRGGARQKVSFWANVSANNNDLISNTRACRCRHDGGQPGRIMTALSPGEARSSLRDRRIDLSETPEFLGDAVLEQARMTANVVQRGDALTLLRSLLDGCTRLVLLVHSLMPRARSNEPRAAQSAFHPNLRARPR